MVNNAQRWLSPREVAEMTPFSERTIVEKCRTNKLPARKQWNRWVIPMAVVEELLESHTRRTARALPVSFPGTAEDFLAALGGRRKVSEPTNPTN
jgi:hypothetical protein